MNEPLRSISGPKRQEDIMRASQYLLITQYYCDDQTEHETSWKFCRQREDEKRRKVFRLKHLKGRDHLRCLCVDGSVI